MTGIKICGITRPDDAVFIARCGAHALGFIFYPKSPRYVTPEHARSIIAALPAASGRGPQERTIFSVSRSIATVGVFVNQEAAEVLEIASFCSLDLIQLHGDESPAYCDLFPAKRVIKALALTGEDDLEQIGRYTCRALLVDAHDPVRRGGTGRTSNWTLASRVKAHGPLILSGGLHMGNIREALAAVGPDAVDINSGVEIAPGIKDHDQVEAIIKRVRELP